MARSQRFLEAENEWVLQAYDGMNESAEAFGDSWAIAVRSGLEVPGGGQ
jgi:hypothetical protein